MVLSLPAAGDQQSGRPATKVEGSQQVIKWEFTGKAAEVPPGCRDGYLPMC